MNKLVAKKNILIGLASVAIVLALCVWSVFETVGKTHFRAYSNNFSVPHGGMKVICNKGDIDIKEISADLSDTDNLDAAIPRIADFCGDSFDAQLYYGNGEVYDLQGRRNSKFSSKDTYLVTLFQDLGNRGGQVDADRPYGLKEGQQAQVRLAIYSTNAGFKKVYDEDLGRMLSLQDIWWEEPIQFQDVDGDGKLDAKVTVPLADVESTGYKVYIAHEGGFKIWTLVNKDPTFSFSVREGVVYDNDELLPGADGESFVIFNFNYAKDKNRVYGRGGPFDAATFVSLDPDGKFVKDKNGAYFETSSYGADPTGHNLIEGADPETFEWVTGVYAKDKNHVYHLIWPTENGEDAATYVRVLDPTTRSDNWTKDKNHAYYNGRIVVGADPSTFRAFNFEFGVDAKNLFFRNTLVPGADVATFELITEQAPSYAKDSKQVYYDVSLEDNPIIEGADPATFTLFSEGQYNLPTGYAKDKNHVFYQTKLIPEADPDTFVFLDDGYPPSAKDKNHVYQGEEVVAGVDPATFTP
ncbi:MAG: hypothetical protein E6Q34_06565 [Burkholderiaceae bacterium]|jgi:hypothetical protein|nr:MAG: hypothetical protein E6Q34_06565 [Burkholderiaceae bacterium]